MLQAEAVGQSAYDASQTGKKAGIVLILESMKDIKYWIPLNITIEHFKLPIDTWSIENAAYLHITIDSGRRFRMKPATDSD